MRLIHRHFLFAGCLGEASSAIRWNGRLARHKPTARVSWPRRRI